jgi:hypothetical protein
MVFPVPISDRRNAALGSIKLASERFLANLAGLIPF